MKRGDRLGRYEIVDLLGAGGMGEVYRALDPELERQVAIKVLPAELGSDEARLARFEREAKTLAGLHHPNLLAIHDIGRDGDEPFLVFELLEGETLQERLQSGPLTTQEVLSLTHQIVEGLAVAHARGIVHRDLKPGNLFIDESGRVKILDFGLARPTVGAEGDRSQLPTVTAISQQGAILGTAAYMAPEQAAGKDVDHRTDQFAVGIVIYEMLTGRRPFAADTAQETLTAILRDEPEPLERASPSTPAPLRWIVERCLTKDPKGRYESTADLARELGMLESRLPELSSHSAESEKAHSRQAPEPKPPRRRRVFEIALLAALAVATGAVVSALFSGRDDTNELTYRQVTFRRGTVTAARFDPTGDAVLYSAAWGGEPEQLFLYRPSAVDPILVGPPTARLADVSPDGELLLVNELYTAGPFLKAGALARMTVTGAPRTLLQNVSSALFGPDGEVAAVIREDRESSVLEFPPGTPRLTTSGLLFQPSLSPDGDQLALAHAPQRGHEWGPIVILGRDGTVQTLAEEAGQGLAWSASGDEIWFVAKDGQNRLDAVTPDGGSRAIAGFPAQIYLHDIAPDGRVLLATQRRRYEMAGRSAGEAPRDLTWLSWSVPFDVSADGETILFNECTGFGFECRTALRGFEEDAPVVLARSAFGLKISPDGQWVVSVAPWSPDRVELISVTSEERLGFGVDGVERIDVASFSPDGEWIYLTGNAPGESTRIFRMGREGGTATPVTPEGIAFGFFAVSPDGERIAAPRVDGTLAIYPVKGGDPTVLAGTEQPIRWSADGESLFTIPLGAVPGALNRVDLRDGRVELVATLAPQDAVGVVQVSPVSVTPDGESWVYGYMRQISELFVVEGLE